MPDYKALYYRLAGRVADVIEILVKAQQEDEKTIMEDALPVLPLEDEDDDHHETTHPSK